jgi:hypothetical protein
MSNDCSEKGGENTVEYSQDLLQYIYTDITRVCTFKSLVHLLPSSYEGNKSSGMYDDGDFFFLFDNFIKNPLLHVYYTREPICSFNDHAKISIPFVQVMLSV